MCKVYKVDEYKVIYMEGKHVNICNHTVSTPTKPKYYDTTFNTQNFELNTIIKLAYVINWCDV